MTSFDPAAYNFWFSEREVLILPFEALNEHKYLDLIACFIITIYSFLESSDSFEFELLVSC